MNKEAFLNFCDNLAVELTTSWEATQSAAGISYVDNRRNICHLCNNFAKTVINLYFNVSTKLR